MIRAFGWRKKIRRAPARRIRVVLAFYLLELGGDIEEDEHPGRVIERRPGIAVAGTRRTGVAAVARWILVVQAVDAEPRPDLLRHGHRRLQVQVTPPAEAQLRLRETDARSDLRQQRVGP